MVKKSKKKRAPYLKKDGKYKDGRRPPMKLKGGRDTDRRKWMGIWIKDHLKLRDPHKNAPIQRQSEVEKANQKIKDDTKVDPEWSLNKLAWQAMRHLHLTEGKIQKKRQNRMPMLLYENSDIKPPMAHYCDNEHYSEMVRGVTYKEKDGESFKFCMNCPYEWGQNLIVTGYGSNLMVVNDDMYDHKMRPIFSYLGTRHITLKSDYRFIKHWSDLGHHMTCVDWLGFESALESEVHMVLGHEDGLVLHLDLHLALIRQQFYPFGEPEEGEEPVGIVFIKTHQQTQVFAIVSDAGEVRFYRFKDIRHNEPPDFLGSVELKPEIRDVKWVDDNLVFMGDREFFEANVTADELFKNHEALAANPETWDFEITYKPKSKSKSKSKCVNFQHFLYPDPEDELPHTFHIMKENGILEEHAYKKGFVRKIEHEDLDAETGWCMHPNGKLLCTGNAKGGVTFVDYETQDTLSIGQARSGTDKPVLPPKFLFWSYGFRDQLLSVTAKRVTRYHPAWTRFIDSLPSEPHVYYKYKTNFTFKYSSMDYSNINHNHRQNEGENDAIEQFIDMEMKPFRDKDFHKKKWSTFRRELEQQHMLDVAYNDDYDKREHPHWTKKKREFVAEIKSIKKEHKKNKTKRGRVANEAKSEALMMKAARAQEAAEEAAGAVRKKTKRKGKKASGKAKKPQKKKKQ